MAGRRIDGVRVVALLKFGKALLLSATLYGAYRLLDPATAALLTHWSESATDRYARYVLHEALDWVAHLSASTIDGAAVVAVGYIALVLVEGVGLWLRRPWAEWLTVIATGALIPFELWRILFRRHEHVWFVIAIFFMNVAIVWYLSRLLRRQHRAPGAAED